MDEKILNNTIADQAEEFLYAKETLLGSIPYVRSKGMLSVEHWVIVATNKAMYFATAV